MMREKIVGLLRATAVFLGKMAALLCIATISGSVVVVSLCSYQSILQGTPLSALPWNFEGSGVVATLLGLGFMAGVFGLGYLHVGLAYGLFLRRIPDFWPHLHRYFGAIYLGTIGLSLIYISLSGTRMAALEAAIFAAPVGFWGTVVYLWRRHKRSLRAMRCAVGG